jgi:hypothetical protein
LDEEAGGELAGIERRGVKPKSDLRSGRFSAALLGFHVVMR